MIARSVASGVTDDRAGTTGKEIARSRAEPPADGDIDRARLSLNQARPGQHQAGPISLSRDTEAGSALIMAHQIDLFCVPQLADNGCLEADHIGGDARLI
jgi:hypothetical protein